MPKESGTEEVGVNDIIGTFESFGFEEMNKNERIQFILKMFEVIVIGTEVEKPQNWIAELVFARLDKKEGCPECLGKGCNKCFGTGKKRSEQ